MFSRCYPTISDMIADLFGVFIPLPIFSYGFFVALGFLVAAWTLSIELRRKEKEGLMNSFQEEIKIGEPSTPFEIGMNVLIGFLLGFKFLWILMNYPEFASNPQESILSAKGSWLGGLAGAAALAGWKYYNKKKQQLDKPKSEWIEVHPYQTVGDLTIVAAISGIAGAKLFYLFESPGNFREFMNDPLGSFFGGLTVYGGLILGTICVMWYARKKGMNPVHIADGAAPGLFLAYGFGRQGCQVSGDGDWGIVNAFDKPNWLSWLPDRLWSFDYPHNIINEGIKIPGCEETHCYILAQPVFPTPMYETFMAFGLFALLWIFRKKFTIPGIMFSLYFILNGVERYFIEKIRVNTKFDFIGVQLTQAEVISMGYVLVGIAGIIYFARRNRKQSG